MKTKSLIYVNRFNKIAITSCIVAQVMKTLSYNPILKGKS